MQTQWIQMVLPTPIICYQVHFVKLSIIFFALCNWCNRRRGFENTLSIIDRFTKKKKVQ